MPQYTVRDEASGRTVTFDWAGAEPPTEADMAEVFAAAGTGKSARDMNPGEQAQDFARRLDAAGYAPPSAAQQAAMGMGALTGGMGAIPAMVATGGAAYLGARLGDRKSRPDAATEGLTNAALEGGGRVVMGLGSLAKREGPKLVQSYLKPAFAAMNRRAGIEGDTASGVAQKISQFIINQKLTSAEKAKALVESSGRQIDDAIASAEQADPNLSLDIADRVPRYFNKVLGRVEQQMLPGKDRTAIQKVAQEFVKDSPLTASTYQPAPPETLEAGLVRGTQAAMTEAANAGKMAPRGPGGSQFTDAGGAFPRSSRPRAIRTDVKPSEGMLAVRTKSFFDPNASGGEVAGGKTLERAIRDAVKQAVPEARAPLAVQGRALDAQQLLDRGQWLAGNRDTLGGFAQTMALSGNLRGFIAQMLKEGQLRIGVYSPEIAAVLHETPQALRALSMALASSHDQPE